MGDELLQLWIDDSPEGPFLAGALPMLAVQFQSGHHGLFHVVLITPLAHLSGAVIFEWSPMVLKHGTDHNHVWAYPLIRFPSGSMSKIGPSSTCSSNK